MLFAISDKRYSELFSSGVTKSKQKSVFRDESEKLVSVSKACMTQYFLQIGDHMPHLNQIHLPHGTKKAVYDQMKDDLLREGFEFSQVMIT